MSWFETLLLGLARAQSNGTELARASILNFKNGLTAAYNATTEAIDVSWGTLSAGAKTAVAAGASYVTLKSLTITDMILPDGQSQLFQAVIAYATNGGAKSTHYQQEVQFLVARDGATASGATYTITSGSSVSTPGTTTSLNLTLASTIGYQLEVAAGVLAVKLGQDGTARNGLANLRYWSAVEDLTSAP